LTERTRHSSFDGSALNNEILAIPVSGRIVGGPEITLPFGF
jgi:hypothetical protein